MASEIIVDKINHVTVTPPASGATITIADGKTLTVTDDATFDQDVDTTASPTFVTETLSGLTASQAVFTDADKKLSSVAVTGTGNAVRADGPTLTSPALGTPASGVLTNCSGLPLTGLVATAWITPAFDAGNFTGAGSMTWTVAEGDVATLAYTIIGKTMTVSFSLNETTVGGTPAEILTIVIPAGKTATKIMHNALAYAVDNSTIVQAVAFVSAGGGTINLIKPAYTAWSASTNATTISGQITFEIN